MNISVSEEMYSVIVKNARAGFHSSVSEYIRSLVRRDTRESLRSREEVKPPPPRRANDCFVDVASSPELARLIFENLKMEEASKEAS